VAAEFLPKIGAIYAAKGVEMRCCPKAKAILSQVLGASLKDATEQDWFEEYLAPIISIKVVEGVDEAIAHINHFSSHHTDAILTRDHMPMVLSTDWGPKSAFPPTNSMPEARWALRA
jgi:glutamate-5-semialdehyde dehydrogenase